MYILPVYVYYIYYAETPALIIFFLHILNRRIKPQAPFSFLQIVTDLFFRPQRARDCRMSICSESKDTKRLQADSTSLADLKAELHRKKGEAQTNKVKGNFRPEKANDGEKKNNIWSKKNTGLIMRMQRDLEKRKEEERSYERAKYMLEKKTRLYESMKKGKGNSSIADNFLVNFNGGIENDEDDDDDDLVSMDYPARQAGEEWVEYTDALGRTRRCMKKDLAALQRQDRDMVREEEEEQETGEGLRKEEPDLLSADMRMDMLRQKWEQQELENLTKESLHYSDVRYDEARSHGAGFYNFSGEEDKRIQEQKTLRKLHEETDEMRRLRERKAEKRKKDMSDRIKKIKAKRREKLGLPPESDSESDNEGEERGEGSDEDDEQAEDISKSVMEGLKMFRRNNEEMERQRNQAIREATSQARSWDRDKEASEEDLGRSREWKVMNQDQWNSQKREERNPDFAPPSAYSEARFLLKNREKSAGGNKEKLSKKSNIEKSPRAMMSMGPPRMPFPPPVRPPGGLMTGPPPPFPPAGLMGPPAPPSAGLFYPPPLPRGPPPRPVDPMSMLDARPEPDPGPAPTGPSYSRAVRLELHKRMQNQETLPGPGQVSGLNSQVLQAFSDSDSDEEDEDPGTRGAGAEVAPPCDMNYFSTAASPNTRGGFRSHHDIAEAFSAGLQANKK